MNTTKLIRTIVCAGLALVTTACIARGPEDYRQVTRSLVDTEKGDIESCFAGQPGKVVVNFTVEKKTGKLLNPVVDPQTTAPAELAKCVVDAVDGLQLDPPDAREGQATFTWRFEVGEPAAG